MRVVSVQVGQIREVPWRGRLVRTAIWKEPVPGRVRVATSGLHGDVQADPSVHGGHEKAVYFYPAEHYPAWREELGLPDLSWGAFGENLTCEGLLETDVRIGDRLRVGTAEVIVTQPRMPCSKLGMKFADPRMIKKFLASRRSGFYTSVLLEGDVAAGDTIILLNRDASAPTVRNVVDDLARSV